MSPMGGPIEDDVGAGVPIFGTCTPAIEAGAEGKPGPIGMHLAHGSRGRTDRENPTENPRILTRPKEPPGGFRAGQGHHGSWDIPTDCLLRSRHSRSLAERPRQVGRLTP